MKNTLLVLLLLSAKSTLYGQFNTISQYGPSGVILKTELQKNVASNRREQMQAIENDSVKNHVSKKPKALLYPPLGSLKETSTYGGRIHPITKEYKFHSGIDLQANYDPVYGIADGIVLQRGFRPIEGNFIKIKHGDLESVYCHLSEIFVLSGQIVEAGKLIGVSGNTGRSTGPHLHFGIKYKGSFINPNLYFSLIK